jgi:hypothetical protein
MGAWTMRDVLLFLVVLIAVSLAVCVWFNLDLPPSVALPRR